MAISIAYRTIHPSVYLSSILVSVRCCPLHDHCVVPSSSWAMGLYCFTPPEVAGTAHGPFPTATLQSQSVLNGTLQEFRGGVISPSADTNRRGQWLKCHHANAFKTLLNSYEAICQDKPFTLLGVIIQH